MLSIYEILDMMAVDMGQGALRDFDTFCGKDKSNQAPKDAIDKLAEYMNGC